jgi:hypothetical protein
MNNIKISQLLRTFIRHFDHLLSRVQRIQIFSTDPQVIVRIQIDRLSHSIHLPEGYIPAGQKALVLHLWNDRLLPMPPGGADLAYARSFYSQIRSSLEALGQYMQNEERLHDVCIVGGVTSHVWINNVNHAGSSMLRRLGFTLFASNHPLNKLGLFIDNFYTWVLMWTFNPASLREHKLLKLQRVEGWMTSERFLERYGNGKSHLISMK